MRQYSVPAVFSESTVSPKLADQVARDTGVKLFLLYTDSLGGPARSRDLPGPAALRRPGYCQCFEVSLWLRF